MNFRNAIPCVLRRTIQSSRIAFYRLLSDNQPIRERIRTLQPLYCTGRGRIELTGCNIGYYPSPRLWDSYCHMEAREPGATIFVDSDVWLNNGATLVAERSSIRIDRGCLIGPSVQIFDSDFHSLTPELRKSGGHECRPVHLEENVFVGTSVIILKGVTIGRNSVIAAGSVVVSDIPENSAAAGVPAKVIANLTRPMADEPTAARRPITSS